MQCPDAPCITLAQHEDKALMPSVVYHPQRQEETVYIDILQDLSYFISFKYHVTIPVTEKPTEHQEKI